MLLKVNDSIVSINFDSSNLNSSVNNKILSLCTLGESFIKTHWQIMDQLWWTLKCYKKITIANVNHAWAYYNQITCIHLCIMLSLMDTVSFNFVMCCFIILIWYLLMKFY